MRILPNNIRDSIAELQSFVYCFHIKLQDNTNLYLTESDRSVSIDDVIFITNSGITLKEGEFNDSSQNYIILEGIFEDGGVEQRMDLTDSIVKIYTCFPTGYNHFVTYHCSAYTKRDLNFTLYLESDIRLYNQPLLQSFSKNCRANFGDLKCKVDKINYNNTYNIEEIFGKTLVIGNCDKESGYFTYGDAVLGNNQFYSKILGHSREVIMLDKVIPDNMRYNKVVELIAGCDKKFITCCNKFNNAVNFRGEPLIPDEDFINVI